MTPFILMIALSIHSMFEGMALGLSATEASAFNMAVAICIHKAAAGLSLGISLVKGFPDNLGLVRLLITIFAVSTPLGTAIGMVLQNAGEIYCVIFNCIAAGTFIYIACNEVILEEFTYGKNRGLKLLALLLGSCIITLLWFLE